MSDCPTCQAEALSWAERSGRPVEDLYPEVFARYALWAPEQPCGGISVNGATPPLCEVHMQPWKHFERHPRDAHVPVSVSHG